MGLTSRVRAPAILGLLLLLALGSCREPTGRDDPFDVSVRVGTLFPPRILDGPFGTYIACEVAIVATAVGDGIAAWEGATFRGFIGKDRSIVFDSVVYTKAEMDGRWNSDSVSRAVEDTTRWDFSLGIPFTLEASFSYRVRSRPTLRTATTRFNCGPELPPGAAAPTLNVLPVVGPINTLAVGDTLVLSFSAASPFGLWETGATLTGPFSGFAQFSERLALNADRSVSFVVPTGADLGQPVQISAYAYDLGGQLTSTPAPTALRQLRVPPARRISPVPLTARPTP